jgi:hypothetical protein
VQFLTSNQPIEDWGQLLVDVPAATAILDRFRQQAEIIQMAGPKPTKSPPCLLISHCDFQHQRAAREAPAWN